MCLWVGSGEVCVEVMTNRLHRECVFSCSKWCLNELVGDANINKDLQKSSKLFLSYFSYRDT